MNRKNLLLGLLAVVVVAACVGLFLVYFEPVEEEITTGYSVAARHNPFLAAQRFMEKLGYNISASRERDQLDQALDHDQYDVIITSYSHLFEKPERRERLMSWVNQGGHLVLEVKTSAGVNDASSEISSENPLLDEFGVTPVSKSPLFGDYEELHSAVQIYQGGAKFQASFLPRHSLEVNNNDYTVISSDDNGTHLVEFEIGRGIVTLLSDIDLWRNYKIGDLDHAALMAEVLGKSPGRIWILYYISMPSLLDILWREAKWAVIPAIAFLFFFLWSLNNRFGSFILPAKRQRRSLLEHIEAAGQFDWRFNQGATLLAGARGDLMQHIESRHPNWDKKSDDEKLIWICEKTKLPQPRITEALRGDCHTHVAFLHAISTLQTLRKLL